MQIVTHDKHYLNVSSLFTVVMCCNAPFSSMFLYYVLLLMNFVFLEYLNEKCHSDILKFVFDLHKNNPRVQIETKKYILKSMLLNIHYFTIFLFKSINNSDVSCLQTPNPH